MSVINKMLRDLDQRNQPTDDKAPGKGAPVDRGTSSVAAGRLRTSRTSETRWLKVMLPGMVVIMALTVWEWQVGDLDKLQRALTGQQRPTVPPPLPKILEVARPDASQQPAKPGQVANAAKKTAPSATVVPPAPAAPAQAAPVAAAVPATPVAPAAAAKPAVAVAAALQRPTTKTNPRTVVVHAGAAAAASPSAAAAPVSPAPATNASAAAPSVPASAGGAGIASTASAQDTAQRQQQAIRDALVQAQSQWNSGAHAPAIELLQQALSAAERAASAAPGPAAQANLASVVRELGRMQLAEGRAGAVWDMTVRLEPQLRTDADVWAVRANAAQRLGRHQDSVHAYLTALQTRPSEQRWLLGAAVSLAALGQTASATEMTAKARAAGPISKEVTAYLRQMGVVVREP